MKNEDVSIEKVISSEDAELSVLAPMLDEAFTLTMKGCPEEVRDIPVPKGEDIQAGLNNGKDVWKIYFAGTLAGGAMISVRGEGRGFLELLFISGNIEGKGIGLSAWQAIEKAYPNIYVWETVTPCFQKRNVHFYVNKCGFHITAYHNKWNPIVENGEELCDEMFVFRKNLREAL